MKTKAKIQILSISVALLGGVHIIATFSPLISGGLEVLTPAKQNAMTYMSLMCGALLIVCGLLVNALHSKVSEFRFLQTPWRIILVALSVDAIAAVAFMPHNPFAWLTFVLVASLVIASLCRK
ncbi:MAG: hypothetical protein HUJ96_10650 [Marinilabiliaceae bacterium]|nr:hypothetical protein [Marinilabiliaceae bacterium]